MANQFLSLSLFLMLLAFFIVLNTMSEFEESKAQPVLNSIARTFQIDSTLVKATPASDRPEVEITGEREGDTLESLEGLFNAHIANFEVSRNRLGTKMQIRLPVLTFENAVRGVGFDSPVAAQSFEETLVTLLRSGVNGKSYRMDMLIELDTPPMQLQRADAESFRNVSRQAASFPDFLQRAGLPAKMMSSGLVTGQLGSMTLRFEPYEPYRVDLIRGEGGRP